MGQGVKETGDRWKGRGGKRVRTGGKKVRRAMDAQGDEGGGEERGVNMRARAAGEGSIMCAMQHNNDLRCC